jgi:apolipoprotein D and lipocalin family protein
MVRFAVAGFLGLGLLFHAADGAAMGRPAPGPELPTVEYVDLDRYLGTWYEVAGIPIRQTRDCYATQATYGRLPNGNVSVDNRCYAGSFEGREKRIQGEARVVDAQTQAKLKVRFFFLFSGDYWIIDLDPDYRWAVVGEPNRDSLFILSRDRKLDAEVLEGILARAAEKGFDLSRLRVTPQPE